MNVNRAARDFVAAIREAEAALDAIKAANDKFYRSENQAEQTALHELRRARERMFGFVAAKEVTAEAPRLTRVLGVRVAPTQVMPFIDYIAHTSTHDLGCYRQPSLGEGGSTMTVLPKRHRVSNLSLKEISSVDIPAQTGAVAVLMKSAGASDVEIRKNAASVAEGESPNYGSHAFEDAMMRRADELAHYHHISSEQGIAQGPRRGRRPSQSCPTPAKWQRSPNTATTFASGAGAADREVPRPCGT